MITSWMFCQRNTGAAHVSAHLSFTERIAEEMGDLGDPVDGSASKSPGVLMPLIIA